MGAVPRDGVKGGSLLFETRRGTLIKRKRHDSSGESTPWGFPFDIERHRRALAIIRQERPSGVCLPRAECRCSWEMTYERGVIVGAPLSPHTRHLGQKYEMRVLSSRGEARSFLEKSFSIIRVLEGLGIQHTDPAFYNFLETPKGLFLIDLDDAMSIEEASCDFAVFLLHTFVPVAGSFWGPQEMVSFGKDLFAGYGGASAFSTAEGRAALQLQFVGALDSLRAVSALRRLEIEHHALLVFAADLAAQDATGPDGSIRELTAQLIEKEREIQNLARAAQERLELIKELDRALRTR
jgi:hypothetical protein